MHIIAELSPEYWILIFAAFALLLKCCYPFAVLIHELGHALLAVCLTRELVIVHIGQGMAGMTFKITHRLNLILHLQQLHLGYCQYPKLSLTKWGRITVASAGPIASGLAITALATILLYPGNPITEPGQWLAIVFFYANLKIFVTSAIPMVYRDHSSGKAYVSDGLDILTTMRG